MSDTHNPDMADRPRSRHVGALARLWPFMAPYWKMIVLAFLALVLTASISLVLPVARKRIRVRRSTSR